jgi:hypothetical protein
LIVPIEEASVKEEYSAATIRKKIMLRLEEYNDLDETPTIINKFNNNLYDLVIINHLSTADVALIFAK